MSEILAFLGLYPYITFMTCLQDCAYVLINVMLNKDDVALQKDFVQPRKVKSLSFGFGPWHSKFIRVYFFYVLSSNTLVTYVWCCGDENLRRLVAVPICAWNILFQLGPFYAEYGGPTFRSRQLPEHGTFILLWIACLLLAVFRGQ